MCLNHLQEECEMKIKFSVVVALAILSASVHTYASDDPVEMSEKELSEVKVEVSDISSETVKEEISSEDFEINAIGGECQLMFPACDNVD